MYAVTFHHWQYCDIKLNYKQKYCVQNVSLVKYYEQNVWVTKEKYSFDRRNGFVSVELSQVIILDRYEWRAHLLAAINHYSVTYRWDILMLL